MEDHHRLLSGRCVFGEPPGRPHRLRQFTYPQLTLTEVRLSCSDATEVIGRLLCGQAALVPGLGSLESPQLNPKAGRQNSGSHYHFVPCEWPLEYVDFGNISTNEQVLNSSDILVGTRTPLYPNVRTAILSFVHDCHSLNESSYLIPLLFAYRFDRRARLTDLTMKGRVLTIGVQRGDRGRYIIKLYGPTVPSRVQATGIPTTSWGVSVELTEIPQYVMITAIDEHGEPLDERIIDFRWGRYPTDLVVAHETRELAARQWIEAGENEHIEFKPGLKERDENQKNDFLETVVAFANSGGGTIILGVTKNGVVHGFHSDDLSDKLNDMLWAKCEPVPSVQLEGMTLDGKPLTLVHVGRSATAVSLDRDKFFIRSGATDRLARRAELTNLLCPVRPALS